MTFIGQRSVAAKVAFLATLGVILVLTVSPRWLWQMGGVATTLGDDKLDHIVGFAVLAAAGYFAWPEQRAKLVLFLVLIVAAVEVLQGLPMIGRKLDAWDWVAGCGGLACGLQIATWTRNFAGALKYEERRAR